MKARILKKSEEKLWSQFLQTHELATIHQGLAWAYFNEKVPTRGKYWIIALEKDGHIVGGTMLYRHKLPRGFTWLYAARGPLLNEYHSNFAQESMDLIMEQIRPIAKAEKSVFLRIDPPLQEDPPRFKGFKESPAGYYPEYTLMVDLTKTEDEILKQMKQKGRYNIKVAQKHEVKIVEVDSTAKNYDNYIGAYHKIVLETTKRDGFYAHRKGHYVDMVRTLEDHKAGKLFLALYKGKVVSGLIATYFKDTATYYYGASSNENRHVMAPYLLQWHVMQKAKQDGYKRYDFLGIAPPDQPKHPWAGVTSFKRKFGGHDHPYIRCQEHSFKPLIHILYKIRKWYKKLSTG